MIITIDGMPGSGKNFIGEYLARKLNYKFYSMGDLMRRMAERKGITLNELNKLRDKGPEIDRDIDTYQAELGREEKNFIITGRPSHHFIPHALKIFLGCNSEEAANRIWPDLQKRNEGHFKTKEELQHALIKRDHDDRKRYMKYYKIDVCDATKFNLCLDTSSLSKRKVQDYVWRFVSSFKA